VLVFERSKARDGAKCVDDGRAKCGSKVACEDSIWAMMSVAVREASRRFTRVRVLSSLWLVVSSAGRTVEVDAERRKVVRLRWRGFITS
jgi:hypothetical protein